MSEESWDTPEHRIKDLENALKILDIEAMPHIKFKYPMWKYKLLFDD